MLSKVEVTNSRGSVLSLPIEENDGGYQISSIEGLEPVKATLVSTSYAGSDGELFQSAKLPARNIKFEIDLDPDFDPKTYTDLRRDLYTYFMPKSQVSMRFYLTSGLFLDIIGVIEDFTSPLFQDDPVVQISIMCYQPEFIDSRIVNLTGFTVAGLTSTEIDYPGTVPSGTVITLHVNRTLSEFTIYNSDESGHLYQLDFTGSLVSGDELVISSLRGNKGITLTRATVSSSFLYGRSPQSSWIEFTQGLNLFRIYAAGDPIPYDLQYRVKYGGI